MKGGKEKSMDGRRNQGKNERTKRRRDPRNDRKWVEKSNIDPRIYLKRVPKSITIEEKSI